MQTISCRRTWSDATVILFADVGAHETQTLSPRCAVFQVTKGRGRASTSEPDALPAPSTATYKSPQRRSSPEAAQSLQSAQTPSLAALPSSPVALSLSVSPSPIHYWGIRRRYSLGTAGTRYRRATRKVGQMRFETWLWRVWIKYSPSFFAALCAKLSPAFFSDQPPKSGILHPRLPQSNHETSVICHRLAAAVRILRSKCIGEHDPGCLDVRFHQCQRGAQLRHRLQSEEKALHQPERHAGHPRLPQQSAREGVSTSCQHGIHGKWMRLFTSPAIWLHYGVIVI